MSLADCLTPPCLLWLSWLGLLWGVVRFAAKFCIGEYVRKCLIRMAVNHSTASNVVSFETQAMFSFGDAPAPSDKLISASRPQTGPGNPMNHKDYTNCTEFEIELNSGSTKTVPGHLIIDGFFSMAKKSHLCTGNSLLPRNNRRGLSRRASFHNHHGFTGNGRFDEC